MPFTIGDFARLGGVSARMLRHYDGLGLLRPARIDEASGYRYYDAAQLADLNRLVALKDLGFRLEDVGDLLDADPGDVRERLQARRAQLTDAIEAERRRLAAVDARLGMLDLDGAADLGFLEKPVPALRLWQLRGEVEDAAELGEQVGPLFIRLDESLAAQGIRPALPSYAWYDSSSGMMRFGVGFAATGEWQVPGVELADLPRNDRALTAVHTGEITRIGAGWQALAREADARGLTAAGPGREVYHECPPDRPADWVVEMQLPVTGSAA